MSHVDDEIAASHVAQARASKTPDSMDFYCDGQLLLQGFPEEEVEAELARRRAARVNQAQANQGVYQAQAHQGGHDYASGAEEELEY